MGHMMSKRGRPRKKINGLAESLVRQYWRGTSAKYYDKKREEILTRSSMKHMIKNLEDLVVKQCVERIMEEEK